MTSGKNKLLYLIYFSGLIIQLIFIIFVRYTDVVKPHHDFWFEKYAYNFINKGDPKIAWGLGNFPDGHTNNVVQQGYYYNWRPIGYSVFLIPAILVGKENYIVVRTIYQLLFYSLIPVLIFLISCEFFYKGKNKIYALLITILWIINPSFLISSIQYLDIWSITLLNLFCFYLLLRAIRFVNTQNYVFLGIAVSTLFFFKPNGILPYVIVLIVICFCNKINFLVCTKKSIWALLIILSVILCWGLRNYFYFGKIDFANSSVGYNMWLGNNKYTNGFLVTNYGDGSAIEDYIVPAFNNEWEFLKYLDEYEKNEFLLNKAIEYIKAHPLETIENAFWKLVGFWSPLRFRDGRWSDSTLKKLVIFFYIIPLLIFSLLSIIKFFIAKEYKDKGEKGLIIIFIFLWMLPYLFFFSTARFRTPLDFCLIILSIDFISPYLSKLVCKSK